MEQRTRQKQKRMLYDSDDEKIDFNSLTEAEQKKISSGMAYGTNYVFSAVRTASDTGRGTGFRKHRQPAERKECVSRIGTGEGTASDAPVKARKKDRAVRSREEKIWKVRLVHLWAMRPQNVQMGTDTAIIYAELLYKAGKISKVGFEQSKEICLSTLRQQSCKRIWQTAANALTGTQ